jgi:CRISPR system Cascade subunit CasC
MKRLVEVHVLQNFVPSNLNRDDTGAPKDAIFGGSRRARISSQCQKRAMRRMFDTGKLIEKENLAERTKLLYEYIKESLVAKGRPIPEVKDKILYALDSLGLSVKDDEKTEYLLFLGRREILKLVEFIDDNWDKLISTNVKEKDDSATVSSKVKKKTNKDNTDPKLRSEFEAILDGGKAADIALFGRMLTDMPEKNQDAACQVAHAISTHVVEREFDYYTAIDDRKPKDNSGASMIGVIDFNSACFYRYACLDTELLEKNLQGDHELTIKTINAFLDAFLRSEPTGKQNSFAAHNPPEFVLVRIAHDGAPVNLANAFECPVRSFSDKSLTQTSAEALINKAISLQNMYGYKDEVLVLNGCGAETGKFGKVYTQWSKVLDAVLPILEG